MEELDNKNMPDSKSGVETKNPIIENVGSVKECIEKTNENTKTETCKEKKEENKEEGKEIEKVVKEEKEVECKTDKEESGEKKVESKVDKERCSGDREVESKTNKEQCGKREVKSNTDKKEVESKTDKERWSGQHLEALSVSSSEDDTPSTKAVRRRKRKPKDTSESAVNRQSKINDIQSVLSSSPIDIEALRELAISDGGLVKDEMRRKAWPILMTMEQIESAPKPPLDVVKAHKEYQQVVLDVQRSLKRFPPGIDDDYRVILMDQLTVLIIRVLMKHPHLNYYQGYHDVAITFLLVMGEDIGYEMMEKLSVGHLCEFMRPTMERTTYYLTYLYPILHRADSQLYKFVNKSGVGTMFCLPWLITWFAHTLADYRNVVRLYDFFLASPYLMPMYIATAIVLQKKEDVLTGECEMAMQHFILSQVPDTLPFEDILVEARRLYQAYPPDTLTQEVEEHLKLKAEEERLEKERLIQRRGKYVARNKNVITTILNFIPIAPAHRRKFVKVALFAASVFVARYFYTYYSTSGIYVRPES